jgi:hypothetical protein
MGVSTFSMIFALILMNMTLFIKPPVPILHNKTNLLSKKMHLLEVTQALQLSMHVPKSYWGDVLLTTAYLINWMPSRVLNFKTPIEVLSPAFSSSIFDIPQVFTCAFFAHLHGSTKDKLDPQALKCIF